MPTLTFKVTAEEAQLIRLQAREERLTVSEYLRRRARKAPARSRKLVMVRCAHTGATIFGALDGGPPLTTEAVRDLVSNFP